MADLFKGSDETHWSKTYSDSNGQVNDLSGKVGEGGSHCHMWKDSEGNSGVEHRGNCKVCDDSKVCEDSKTSSVTYEDNSSGGK